MSASEVAAVIHDYVTAVSAGDVPLLERTFRPDARMWGYLGDEKVAAPIQEFFDVVSRTTGDTSWIARYTSKVSDIRVEGDVATAVLEESGYVGASFVNFFTLIRDADGWRIASKTFTTTPGERS